ncbi:TIGR01244 family sulfur transferase [Pontixanthobacter sp.]|uniref:TIGR01244 family sulfur transferase n=1 Tax=Pontixanthobacter sp. TaxID=2792078 RepID=UPI003C79EF78
MSDFRHLDDHIMVSPQISLSDIHTAKAQGVRLIINNRPDDEDPGQLTGAEVEAAACAAGITYLSIPVGHAGFGDAQVAAMASALHGADGRVLAYCRSGTRSTLLWALSQAHQGRDPDALAAAAKSAGYDVSPVHQAMKALAAKTE